MGHMLSWLLRGRRRTHEAATTAAEEGARLALKAAEHASKLRDASRLEQQELAKQKRLSFQQKVCRGCCRSVLQVVLICWWMSA